MSSTISGRQATVLKLVPVVSGALLLSACGGAGGSVSSPGDSVVTAPVPPAPAPPPPPTPPPPPPASARSAEYQRSGAVVGSKAGVAYDKGVTGKGVTIAILDTGIDVDGPEFAGRISPDSRSFENRFARCNTCAPETITFGLDDVTGHGTLVTSIAAAARNDAGVHGVAYDATILALKISGPDLDNVTAGGTPRESGSANTINIAPAIRYAVDKNAFAIVLALNGTVSGPVVADLRGAMDQVRLADRLVIESVSNFTDEDSFTGQIAETLVGTDRANQDWFLFAIGVDQNGNPRSANGNAGPLAARMIAATGNNVQAVDKDGQLVTVTGNSFAAPTVAGAAALLKEYWPQLGGKAISRILLDTATDLGAPGVDQVYGVGLLNLEKALQPQASSQSLRAASTVLDLWSSVSLSPAFGGAAGGQALSRAVSSMIVLDNYGRDYALAGQGRVRGQTSGLLAGGMLASESDRWTVGPLNAAFALTGSSYQDSRMAERDAKRPVSFSVTPAAGQRLTFSANTAVGAQPGEMFGSGLRTVAAPLVGTSASWEVNGWTTGFSSGHARQQGVGSGINASSTYRMGEVMTPWGVGLRVAELGEVGRMLGAVAGPEFGITGARTRLTTITAVRRLLGVDLMAEATAGRTTATGSSELLRFTAPITSTSFSLRGRKAVLGGQLQLGLASPLRVQTARASVLVPMIYDLATDTLTSERRFIDLAPTARELDLELGWWAPLSDSAVVRLGVAHAFDAGHVASASDTAGFLSLTVR